MDAALACLFAVMPKQLFSPKEMAWLVLFFLLFVCFPVTVLLPITLANNANIPAPGYVGRILPVLYTVLVSQWVCYRCMLRYCHFGLGFQSNLLAHENFSPQTVHAMWKATFVAFVQLKSNRIPITRESTELQLDKVIEATPLLSSIVDLREKMQVGFQNPMSSSLFMYRRPQAYLEHKLLSLLFPASQHDLQEWNSGAICRVSRRWWCWKRNIVWMVLFVGMVFIPLAILIPVSVTMTQDATDEISTSDVVAIFVSSILFPVLYAIFLGVELVLCCKRRCNNDDEHKEATAPPPPTNNKPSKVQFAETKRKSKTPRTVEGLQRANVTSAQADLTAAFVEVDQMFKFEWSASASSKRDTIIDPIESVPSLLPVFQSLATFNKESDAPGVRLIRAQALAGQIRLGIFSYLRSTTVSHADEEEELEAIHAAAKQLVDNEPNETILLHDELLHSQFLYEIFCSVDFANESVKSFELWEQEVIGAFEHCNTLLFGFQLLPTSDLEYVERTFCRLIFRLMRTPVFPRKKELEYLAWIGYNRVRLAQKSNCERIILECNELHCALLVNERERAKVSGDAQRRKSFYTLVNHFQVKRSIFWLQMLKHHTQVDQLWEKYNRYEDKQQHVGKTDYERLLQTKRDLQSDLFALMVIEVEKPMNAAAPVTEAASTPQPIDLFSSQLWNSLEKKLSVIDSIAWISFQEERWIETLLAQAQALEILLCFKQNMNTVEALVGQFHARFPQRYEEDEYRIAFLFTWIKLVAHKTRVQQEWTVLLDKKTNTNVDDDVEDTFRRSFSFGFEARFANHALYCTKVERLHAQACAGLILMHLGGSQLEQAQEWAVTMQNSLPLRTIQSNKHLLHALRELRRTHAKHLLGRFLFPWYWMCVEHTRVVVHVVLFWLVVVLPLVLGINFVAHAQLQHVQNGFFLQWFGILLPVFYLLLVALRWTLVRRVKWFGEQESVEELNEAADMMLSVRGSKWWEGGEYPKWEMGEHVITSMAENRQLYTNKRGLRLVLQRAGLVLVCFAVLPIVIIAPLLTLDWVVDGGAVRSALWVIIIALPVCTCAFVLVRIISEAVPRPIWHGIYSIAVWLALLFILPLLCAPPMLNQQHNSGDVVACLWIWLICGPVLTACTVCVFTHKYWREIKYWCTSLTWDEHSLHEILHFLLQANTLAASLFPVVSLLFLIGARASPGLQGGNSLFIAVAVFQLLACIAGVAVCTIGIKLGYIHPEMAVSSLLPVFYVSFGSFVMFESLMAATGAASTSALNGFRLQRLMDVALWCCGLQLLCAIWYAVGVHFHHRERKRFGYFPEDWELFDPTARFVVEEAKHVPFLSDAELNQTLGATQLSRREMETMLEECLREDAQKRAEEDLLVEQRITELRQRYTKQKLAELVFSQVLMATGLQQQQCMAVVAQFPVVKWRYSLLQVVRTHSLLMGRFRKSTHLLQMVQSGRDMRIVNMLFGVLHPLPFSTLQEFAWIDEDGLVDEPGVKRPDIIVRSLEFTFCNRGGVRVLVFESKEQRRRCIEIIFEQTIARERSLWVYVAADASNGGIDRLQRKPHSNLA